MADLYGAISQVVQGLLAKRPKPFQPGKVLSVNENGTYAISANGAPPVVSVPAGDFPLKVGDPVWVAATWTPDKWVPASYDPKTGISAPGYLLPGFLTPAQARPVILGKLVD